MSFHISNLKFKKDGRGTLVFYETNVAKFIKTLVLLALLYAVWYILEQQKVDDIINTWQFQIAGLLAFIGGVYIWHRGFVEFDEMTKTITLNRGLRKLFSPREIPYSKVSEILLKKYTSEDEDGHVTVEGYFHLCLKNGRDHLLFVFEGSEHIFEARKKLKNHLSLKISG